MRDMFKKASTAVGRSWCQAMHPDPMWPINGAYQCPKCLRRFAVPWEVTPAPAKLEHARLLTASEAALMGAGTRAAAQAQLTALPPAA